MQNIFSVSSSISDKMNVFRKYGRPPFRIILVHGGPGAVGEMKPVAMRLAEESGVVECFNRGLTVEGQLKELEQCVAICKEEKPVIAGFSWGAWLSILFAARHSDRLGKLILIGSGPLEIKYAQNIHKTRMSRLNENRHKEFSSLISELEKNNISDRDTVFKKLGSMVSQSDSFDPVEDAKEEIELHPEVYLSVWKEASDLRENGQLLNDFLTITCPVVAIHGDYDPHPYKGILIPGQKLSGNFQFELLKNCGHTPWMEKQAKENFFRILGKYIR